MSESTANISQGDGKENKLGLASLIALIIGSMIGGGAFNIPSDMAKGASSGAVIIGWVITGIGMISLAFVYQNLANRKPELNGGVYSYAKAGFGQYIGFNSAWGYWLSAFLGNVAYATLFFGAIGYFIPAFGEGNNLPSIIGASIFVWAIHGLILKGVKQAAFINLVTTIAKLIPIFIFIIAAIFAFNFDNFSFEFWGNPSLGSVVDQVKNTMLVTLWVFIGIEGAVVVSGRAKKKSDVGKATVIGLVGTLCIYLFISLMSLGVMQRADLSELNNPSMAFVLEQAVGKWGAVLINLGLIISLFGSLLGWTLLSAEIPYVAAKDGVLPKIFAKESANGAPKASLWITNGLVQLVLIITLFSSSTYQALAAMASAAILVPYLLSALYGLKISIKGETYNKNPEGRGKDIILSLIASIYACWLVYAAGLEYLLLCAILYAVGIICYYVAKKEDKNCTKIFSGGEIIIALVIVVAAIAAIVLLANGTISI